MAMTPQLIRPIDSFTVLGFVVGGGGGRASSYCRFLALGTLVGVSVL
jgi:hypothetical protein